MRRLRGSFCFGFDWGRPGGCLRCRRRRCFRRGHRYGLRRRFQNLQSAAVSLPIPVAHPAKPRLQHPLAAGLGAAAAAASLPLLLRHAARAQWRGAGRRGGLKAAKAAVPADRSGQCSSTHLDTHRHITHQTISSAAPLRITSINHQWVCTCTGTFAGAGASAGVGSAPLTGPGGTGF